MDYHLQYQPIATLSVSDRKSSRYLLFDNESQLCGWQNVSTGEERICIKKEKYRPLAFSGIHIVNKTLLTTRINKQKYSITDWYLDICSQHKILGYNNNAVFIDVGKIANVEDAEKIFP